MLVRPPAANWARQHGVRAREAPNLGWFGLGPRRCLCFALQAGGLDTVRRRPHSASGPQGHSAACESLAGPPEAPAERVLSTGHCGAGADHGGVGQVP
eukprot:10080656-Alexandrium_andersonii.AAC.1